MVVDKNSYESFSGEIDSKVSQPYVLDDES
jgi:hypothetical protein